MVFHRSNVDRCPWGLPSPPWSLSVAPASGLREPAPPAFRPITVSITLECLREYETLRRIASLDETIPKALAKVSDTHARLAKEMLDGLQEQLKVRVE